MAREAAEIRGRAMVRPYRVAQLVDTTDAVAVREAFVALSRTWGGIYMPIFDSSLPVDELEHLARGFDVDAIWSEATEGVLAEWLRESGSGWLGGGDWGPFAQSKAYRSGLLLANQLDVARDELQIPEWPAGDPLDLLYTALFGCLGPSPPSDVHDEPISFEVPASSRVGLGFLYVQPDLTAEMVGPIRATAVEANAQERRHLDGLGGAVIARTGHPEDLVLFWNLRTYGLRVLCLPEDGPEDLLRFVTRGDFSSARVTRGSAPEVGAERALPVWGLDSAGPSTLAALEAMATRLGMVLENREDRSANFGHPGLHTRFESTFRSEMRSTAPVAMVRTPPFPLTPGSRFRPGVVAVEISVYSTTGLDPRAAPQMPPYRRHGKVLERIVGRVDRNHIRIMSEGNGVVVGQQASLDEAPVGFATHIAGIQALFDDDTLRVEQSDDGKFQTRASEMLGGPHGTLLLHPGVRAAIDKTAASPTGLSLVRLRRIAEEDRGVWPDVIFASHQTPKEYAREIIDNLLFSGLFVPMLDVHCSSCRVESQVSPRDLDATIRCEFCGEDFRLALSLSISRSKAQWRYRLAGHLSPQKVKALLPVLATASLFGQFQIVEGPMSLQAFGVKVAPEGREPIEVDIVTYLGSPNFLTVLGEVKTSNRVDEKDVRNLEDLQVRLDAKKVRSLLLFATLKDEFGPTEVKVLRELVERSRTTMTAHGALVPRFPLVLTGKDLSLPWSHDEHPWRWEEDRSYRDGLFGTAIQSCRRNLGLLDFKRSAPGAPPNNVQWDDRPTESPTDSTTTTRGAEATG